MTLITTSSGTNQTAMTFDSGIDSTYRLYIFKFFDINPATDAAELSFQFNVAGGADYDETLNTTVFRSSHWEADDYAAIQYMSGIDQANGTGFQFFTEEQGNGADESLAGEMHLFNPSNTTFVKQFNTRTSTYVSNNGVQETYVAGYVNTTAAVDDVQFKMSSGNFDGTIKMYGVK